MSDSTVFTVGHSTHPIERFIGMLKAHGVKRLVDVRTIPKSRHNPQFNQEALAESLREAGMSYRWAKALGGLRHAKAESPNSGWRNASFRGYADYMQTAEFAAAVDDLVAHAAGDDLVLMCAEAVPWRCHRSLIADALLVRKLTVMDIMSETKAVPHKLTSFARVVGTRITYPPEPAAAPPREAPPEEAPPSKP